ncbi:MAG: cytochrome c [Oscillatoriaceae cyanobacterium Prado104]|jgi:mono/diheme cytochrome c family protein|nr:cytochrome c [Oscillatoriaceae cyanobacterium Prado104]
MKFMSTLIQCREHWWCRWNRSLLVILLTGILWFGNMTAASAAAVETGKTLFEQSCAACHSIDGSGASYGPDLQTVTQRRDRNWLISWIAAPEKVIESGDAIAAELLAKYNGVPMPNAGLQPDGVESIVSYLENVAGTASKTSPQAATATPLDTEVPASPSAASNSESNSSLPPAGDATIGQKLFAGTIPFHNGGPACMSCHTVDAVGALRGGTLGPNLTHVIDRYTEAGLKGVLPALPYPTMQGIYQNKLLTEDEQAQLLAFFKAANGTETAIATANTTAENNPSTETASFQIATTWKFILLGVGGSLLLALIGQITWRDRLTGVRQRLVEGQKS